MFKKIYIEITNNCNLNCSFCIKNSRPIQCMNEADFKLVLEKIKNKTKYLYFHVLGEPLLHPEINKFIEIASKEYKINITTNGYLINRLNSSSIRQLNISLQSYDEKYNIPLEDYMNNIIKEVNTIKDNTYISFRIWTKSKYVDKIIEILNKNYNKSYKFENLKKNNVLGKNIFLNKENKFIWPSLNNDYYEEKGSCYGLRDHIGILCDGTVIPCCLDSKGEINLGNIYNENIDDILSKDICLNIINGFRNNKKLIDICKKCKFR